MSQSFHQRWHENMLNNSFQEAASSNSSKWKQEASCELADEDHHSKITVDLSLEVVIQVKL